MPLRYALEDWTASIGAVMTRIGGKVFRRALGEVRNALFHPEDYAASLPVRLQAALHVAAKR
jgi:hypothetical protein